MFVSLKNTDDRPRVLWRCLIVEPIDSTECKMKDVPLDSFICTQVMDCKFNCLQKIEQLENPEYVMEQQKKMLVKIENISFSNGNNGKKIKK